MIHRNLITFLFGERLKYASLPEIMQYRASQRESLGRDGLLSVECCEVCMYFQTFKP